MDVTPSNKVHQHFVHIIGNTVFIYYIIHNLSIFETRQRGNIHI